MEDLHKMLFPDSMTVEEIKEWRDSLSPELIQLIKTSARVMQQLTYLQNGAITIKEASERIETISHA